MNSFGKRIDAVPARQRQRELRKLPHYSQGIGALAVVACGYGILRFWLHLWGVGASNGTTLSVIAIVFFGIPALLIVLTARARWWTSLGVFALVPALPLLFLLAHPDSPLYAESCWVVSAGSRIPCRVHDANRSDSSSTLPDNVAETFPPDVITVWVRLSPAVQARMRATLTREGIINEIREALARHSGSTPQRPRSGSTPTSTEPEMGLQDIKRKCEKEWGTDYRMQEYCRNQQEEARVWARGRPIDTDIGTRCSREWPNDWRMFVYCVKQQETAKSRL